MKDCHDQQQDCRHQHGHSVQHGPEELLQFFSCCLGEEPPPISEKIRALREKIPLGDTVTEVQVRSDEQFVVYGDMIVADLLNTFPVIQPYLADLHPLGMLSPTLHNTTLEIFLSDLDVEIDNIYRELEQIINSR